MGKKFKYLCNLIESIVISRQETREQKHAQRRAKLQKRIDSYRARLEFDKDQETELKMKDIGYCRCELCKSYMAPDKMLQSISSASLTLANDSKKFTPEEIAKLHTLIINKGHRKPQIEDAFTKFKPALNKISVKCRDSHGGFGRSDCFNCDGAYVFGVESIIELQQKQIDLIYMNRQVIEFEANCV